MNDNRALVLFSGGQDSATCLAWALAHFRHVETVGFDYGQRHRIELEQRQVVREALVAASYWPRRLADDHVLDLGVLGQVSQTALTRSLNIGTHADSALPNTFVPGRNIMFLTLAAALAWRRDIRHIVTGVCETDFSGYPDCRDDTIKALQVTLNLGMERRFIIHTPLMHIDKAMTWAMAESLGGDVLVDLIIEHTHTCYLGDRSKRHPWGYGCGECPACEIRAHGFERFRDGVSVAA